LIAAYDYGGYYNVCLIGDEVDNPKKTIPRSILFSIFAVGAVYLAMNLCIVGVLPWREAMASKAVVTDMMVRVYGPQGGAAITILVLLAAFGSVFAILLGYSRIPYAAARQGQFFAIFGQLHPTGNFPYVAVVVVGVCSALACMFTLENLITALIVVQTLLQFAAQCVAVMLLRQQKREPATSYRMPLYPMPALLALAGWLYIAFSSGWVYVALAFGLMAVGIAIFLWRANEKSEWPFAEVRA
jgi:amino acid transporter